MNLEPQLTVSDAPKSFPDAHKSPELGDEIYLLRRISNTSFTGEIGLALMQDALFIGWISKGDQWDLAEAHLLVGGTM